MKVNGSMSFAQFISIGEDLSYWEAERDRQLVQPETYQFLKQLFKKTEIKLIRRLNKCKEAIALMANTEIKSQEEKHL